MPRVDYHELGTYLRKCREATGKSIAQVAKEAGMHRSALGTIENQSQTRSLPAKFVKKLVKAISADETEVERLRQLGRKGNVRFARPTTTQNQHEDVLGIVKAVAESCLHSVTISDLAFIA